MIVRALKLEEALAMFEDEDSGMWETFRAGFQLSDSSELRGGFRKRIARIKESGKVYVVKDPDVCALLIVSVWSKKEGQGKRFYESLTSAYPQLTRIIDSHPTLACNIVSIATHPDYRSKGYAQTLLKQCLDEYQPAFVVGQTRNPILVQVRSNQA